MSQAEEMLDVINLQGRVIGRASRRECHQNPGLLHRVVHVLVENRAGGLYLQKRAAGKDIQPGKWDTSVGGHLLPGETPLAAARRELSEELGIVGGDLEHLYHYTHSNCRESEWVDTFRMRWSGIIRPNPDEIEEGRWWEAQEIEAALSSRRLTPNFADEFKRWQAWRKRRQNLK